MPGGVQGITPHPWPSPRCQGSHRNFQTHAGDCYPNHRCQPQNVGTHRQQEMPGAPQVRGVPMDQMTLHWGG